MDWKNTVASAVNGDAEAWSLIFEKTQSMVYFTCVKLLHNVDAAEDIAQDVYVSAILFIQPGKASGSVRAPIFFIADTYTS